jgi:hypothetical protein
MKTFLLPEPVAQKTIDYLVKRPYDEVYLLIAELMQLQTIEPTLPLVYKEKPKEE